jgi:hypothetical protein
MARKIVLTSSVFIMEGNGQVSKLQLYDRRFKGRSDGPIDLGTKKPISILVFTIWLMPNYRKSFNDK